MKKEVKELFDNLKEKHPDRVILMRIGDLYYAFCDDGKTVSEAVGKPLTVDEDGEQMFKFKDFELDTYLPKIIRAGNPVCIYDHN